MAKKKSNSKSSTPTAAHPTAVASPRLVVRPVVRLSPVTLPLIEDRRRYNPTKTVAPPASIRKDQARVTLKSPRARILQTNTPLGFSVPEKVALCVRRAVRKEVLHAKKVAGKSGLKKPRRNFWSKIKC